MAIRLTARPLRRENIEIGEGDKILILPSRDWYNTEADDAAERDLRDAPTPDRTEAVAHWHFILGFAAGAAAVLCIAAIGMVMSLR